ncbi:MAG: hypothetical protein KY439_00575 [Actinobacteria bacterium]|nr:hypothetical protein [Actinomycetota bacterium]
MPQPSRRCPRSRRRRRRAVGVLACVAVALGSACSRPAPQAAEPPASERLKQAVVRTIDEGSARVVARLRSDAGVVVVEGVTSLVGREAWARATVEGLPQVASEVRVTAAGTWLRPPGATEWIAVDAAVAQASPAGSWGGLLRGLAGATSVRGQDRHFAAVVDGAPVTVLLDGQDRVAQVQRRREGLEVTVELSDFGVGVEVEAP